MTVARDRTALTRANLSRPISTAICDGILRPHHTVFDYGCGKGDDLRFLRSLGYQAHGWDPVHRPNSERRRAHVVNLGYVLNVIEHSAERAQVLRSAWDLASGVLVVSARMSWDSRGLVGRPFGDGIITRTGTFQKFYAQTELAEWIEQTIGKKPFAAAPGIFYVFREEAAAQRFVASRVYTYRPRMTIDPHAHYEAHEDSSTRTVVVIVTGGVEAVDEAPVEHAEREMARSRVRMRISTGCPSGVADARPR